MNKKNKRKPLSKYTIGKRRAERAKRELNVILRDEDNPLFLCKDTDFAERYGVTRLTIRNIRTKYLNIPSRSVRIAQKLRHIKTEKLTIKELGKILKLKYQNLYKIVIEENIPVKPDTPPIESMISHQRNEKAKKAEEEKIKKQKKKTKKANKKS